VVTRSLKAVPNGAAVEKTEPRATSINASDAAVASTATFDSSDIVARFKTLYRTLNRDSLSRSKLADFYSEDIQFRDSLHEINGLSKMLSYFEAMYENVPQIKFDFHDEFSKETDGGSSAMITWTMAFQHSKLNRGKEITVQGSTHLRSRDGKVFMHRDYFDAGEMLYEHIPGLALVIRQLKKRLA
jgi:SnoaL-like protein